MKYHGYTSGKDSLFYASFHIILQAYAYFIDIALVVVFLEYHMGRALSL